MTAATPLEAEIRAALADVEDPEVPITLADLGVLRAVEVEPGEVRVHLAPTRLGCPGRDEMERRVREAVRRAAPDVDVHVEWEMVAWRPDDITERGAGVLAEYGYALLTGAVSVRCPYCRSEEVRSDGNFGGSICKRPYTCRSCGSTFDALRSLFDSG
ncbi:MAG: iron-sulfur cluster assembly protein [Actinomycetota bacterium]